jgi:3-phosphoshikimate 1-carboxyvinyltransferase
MAESKREAHADQPGNFLPKDAVAAGVRCVRNRDEPLDARVRLEGSKSISNRALILRALAGAVSGSEGQPHGPAPLEGLSISKDTQTLQALLEQWIQNRAHTAEPLHLDAGAAGTTYRFMTAFLAAGGGLGAADESGTVVLDGSERMRQRPIKVLVDALRTLGASIEYLGEEGFPPLRIQGRALSGEAQSESQPGASAEGMAESAVLRVPANISSQYISALLMIGPTLASGLRLELEGKIGSRPYIDMTLALMRRFGARAYWVDTDWGGDNGPASSDPGQAQRILVESGAYRPTPFRVEGDWSAASYYYGLCAVLPAESRLLVDGLYRHSVQGDSVLPEIYTRLGVETHFTSDGVQLTARPEQQQARFDFDFTHCPDLAQTVVVTGAILGIPMRLTGLESLAIKETDRTAALRTELARYGVRFDRAEDHAQSGAWELSGRIHPPAGEMPTHPTYEDHRMAMAFAPLAQVLPEWRLEHPDVVAKSYPTFWNDWAKMGMRIEAL